VIWVAGTVCAVAAAYQILAILACLRHWLHRPVPQPLSEGIVSEGISIMKPVHGLHAGFAEAIRSHLHQTYPRFELLLGYADSNDSAIPEMNRQGARNHFLCPQTAPNAKAGVLMDLATRAQYPLIVVNDADIVVPPDYLRDVTAPLADPSVGVVTCLYRAEGGSWPSRFEALGVATDFAPSALVAPWAGVAEFGFGSTLAFRRVDLDAIGGFAAVSDYLADDYQIGARIHRLGRRNVISPVVVKTRLHTDTWADVWKHQVRWARTIRLSRPGGYAGLPVTFATMWAIAAGIAGFWWMAFALLGIRIAMGFAGGWLVLRSPDVLTYFALIPVRDLFAVAVWAAGLTGDTVEWGGQTLRLDREGRIKAPLPSK
jgi:ceramide glucosyltransferase